VAFPGNLPKPNIASIRGSGLAHGKKGGTVTISASASGVTGTTTLTVGTGRIELSPIGNPRVAAILYIWERLKQYVAAIKGAYIAEIEAGRFGNEPNLWVCVYRDEILPGSESF